MNVTRYLAFIFFFVPVAPSTVVLFPIFLRTFFGCSFRGGLLAVNYISFPSSENVFMSSSFLKTIFSGYRILFIILSFQHFKKFYFFLLFLVSDKKYSHSNQCSLNKQHIIFLFCFQFFLTY